MERDEDEESKPQDAPQNPGGRWFRREFRAFLELLALTTIAVTQPLLDSLRKNATDVMVARRLDRFSVWLLMLIVVLVPAVVLWLVEVVAGLVYERARRVVHAILAGFVGGVIVFEIFGTWFSWPVIALTLVAIVLGVALAFAVGRSQTVRSYLRILAIGAIVFPLLFVTSASVSPLALEGSNVAAADITVTKPRDVVMIVTDELPLASLLDGNGKIDAGLFPNFATLARDSHWYRNTTSVAPYTSVAVPAILSGSYPTDPRKLPTAQEYPRTLFSLLGGAYDINDHEIDDIHLCPANLCPTGGGDLGGALDDAVDLWTKLASPSTTTNFCACDLGTLAEQMPQGKEFLQSVSPASGTKPRLDYLHVVMPHAPWRYLPTGQYDSEAFTTPKGLDLGTLAWISSDLAEVRRHDHLMQLQATDRLLGQIIAKLKEQGRYDDSIVVLTADHGAAFVEGSSYRSADDKNYAQVMWVPLFVKVPGEEGVVDDRPARTIDVLPTIADLIGVQMPWTVDGVSLRGDTKVSDTRRFMNWGLNALFPPEGEIYHEYDGRKGFQEVLATPPIPDDVDDARFRLYGIGKNAKLVGKPVGEYAAKEPSALSAVLNSPELFRDVRPNAPFVPAARVEGGLDGQRQIDLAIVVNGVVASVAPTSPSYTGTPSFSMLIPPQLLKRGPNQIDLYEVRGTAPELAQIKRLI